MQPLSYQIRIVPDRLEQFFKALKDIVQGQVEGNGTKDHGKAPKQNLIRDIFAQF